MYVFYNFHANFLARKEIEDLRTKKPSEKQRVLLFQVNPAGQSSNQFMEDLALFHKIFHS